MKRELCCQAAIDEKSNGSDTNTLLDPLPLGKFILDKTTYKLFQ